MADAYVTWRGDANFKEILFPVDLEMPGQFNDDQPIVMIHNP